MSEKKKAYDRALATLAAHDRKYRQGLAGHVGVSAENVRAGLVQQVLSLKEQLVEEGLWEGPRVITSKAKHRKK